MIDNFSSGVQKIISLAETFAKEFHHPVVGSEHLLLAILKNDDLLISKELKNQKLKYEGFFDKTRHLYIKEKRVKEVSFSLELKEILEEAIRYSHKNKEVLVSFDSLSIVLLTLNSTALEMLINSGVDTSIIIKKILASNKKKSELLSINDLHLLGANNKDPLIGRDNEIIQLIYALSRRNKPNAILIGEPGVGKTAIVEELAKRLLNNKIPLLKDKNIYELDLASTVSGTKYRGEFEDKLRKIIKKVKEDGNAILFIDEIHNVIKAGGAEGAIDASNILKPYLARGEIQLIGATTLEEFTDSFDKDKALKRRFQIINVDEPSLEEVLNILSKIKPIYEDYYDIEIKEELLKQILEFSNKYILNQRFPDKAIELLDNACVIADQYLTKENIITTINKLYGISVNDEEKIDKFRLEFNKIFNQDKVKMKLENIFKKEEPNSLLFVGNKGTGKNSVASIIGRTMYSNIINLKIDNYNDINAINRLTSNGFSYSGEQVSPLIKTLKEKPNSTIVFEGVESINKELISFFESILEKGYLIDSKGNKIITSNALFIFTMNLDNKGDFKSNLFKSNNLQSRNKIEEILGDRFISLLDEVITFENITQEVYKKIVAQKLLEENLSFEISNIPDIEEHILLNKGGDIALKKAKEIIKEEKFKKIKIK